MQNPSDRAQRTMERTGQGQKFMDRNTHYSLEMMAEVYSEVDAFPPKSPVMDLPSAMVCRSIRSAICMLRSGIHVRREQPFLF
jgi:hypothetical protein